MTDGRGQLPKLKLSTLLYDALPFDLDSKPAKAEVARSLAGAAVICGAATSKFTSEGNHLAEFEAWCLLWCHTAGIASRWNMAKKSVSDALGLASEGMYSALARLCDELRERDTFTEGDALIDARLYKVRMTHLLGLMGLYGLWIQERKRNLVAGVDGDHLDFVVQFCERHSSEFNLWGEYAIPQFLSWYFFRQTHDATYLTDGLIAKLVELIARSNHPDGEHSLFNPYYDAEDCLPHVFGLSREPLQDSFSGSSYYLEGLLHFFVRSGLKQELRAIFPEITRISMRSFEPEEPWQFFRYRNWDTGKDVQCYLSPPHRWSELKESASECSGTGIPSILHDYPIHYLALLMVMPHRVNSSGLRWLATQMGERASDKSWQ